VGVRKTGITTELDAKDATIWLDVREGTSGIGVDDNVRRDTGDCSCTVDECAELAMDWLICVACPDEVLGGGLWKLTDVELAYCCCAEDTCVL